MGQMVEKYCDAFFSQLQEIPFSLTSSAHDDVIIVER